MTSDIPVIILAGGLGTRLRSVIDDLPKAMAPVNGKPFLHYIFQYLVRQNVAQVVLSVGYRRQAIHNFFGDEYLGIRVRYAIEEEPLGTGGGIKKAFMQVNDFAFVLNGDTFFDVDLNELAVFHEDTKADISLSLKPMKNFDRYGTVQLQNERIIQFDEKKLVQRPSKDGNYLGITLPITATSREQLDELYRTLSTHPLVSIVL